ncbi:PIG-L deacetylase family protein [Oceanobacillus senegalensis]|uniref:PIG-L deacetylase family protein n=1 Tax=Oceanobacillus senegalensis TaxID=1936063 RepID=UPI000A3104A7|nr:PIG-L family deacetylase [Oceanobacillus senegalensis]
MNIKQLIMNVVKPINIPITRWILKRHYSATKPLSGTLGAKRVLVLAPHMDDETIGPGGILRKHANEGAEVHVAIITDGSSSVSDLSKEALTAARMKEMDEVKSILGIHTIHYLGLPDGGVKSNEASQSKVESLINDIEPDIIYSTPFVDAHPDHTATVKTLSDVLKKRQQKDTVVRLYEINCPFPPTHVNCVVDISETMADKQKAIDVFSSQVIAFDGFVELNRLKSKMVNQSIKYAEVFMEFTPKKLNHHCDTLDKHRESFPHVFKQANRTDTLLWAIYKNNKWKTKLYEDS